MPPPASSCRSACVKKKVQMFGSMKNNSYFCRQIAESVLSAKDNEMLVAAINRHWKHINEQISKVFNGEKTISIDIEK